MRSSKETANVSDALVKASLLLTNPTKGKTAQIPGKDGKRGYSYTYADLGSILDDVRPILQAHQLVLVQEAAAADGGVAVATRIIHASGEWIEYAPLIIPCAANARSIGSATTYARRYTVCAALGIAADEDDDGAKASPAPRDHAVRDVTAPSDNEALRASAGESSEGVSGGEYGEGSTPAPPSDARRDTTALVALLEAVAGSEAKAINAVNKAMHTAYDRKDLDTLEPEDWEAGLKLARGN